MNKTIYTEFTSKAAENAADASASSIRSAPGKPGPGPSHSRPPLPLPQTLEEKWEKAGIEDAFIFGSVMSSNKDLLLELLQLSLPEMEIEEILDAGQEVHIKTAVDAHGVRLDVSVRDNKGRIFDVEMQLRDESDIPRRIRYYTGTLDQTNLKPGESYNQLKDTVVLFITRFDPFNRKRRRYTFRNICLEEKDTRLELGDGTTKVILNAAGKEGNIPSALKDFLDLVMGIRPSADDSYAGRVQKQVEAAKRSSALRREYMNWEMTLLVERDKGRAEGKAEGRTEGDTLRLIRQILLKLDKGKSEDLIASEVEEDIAVVHQFASIAAGMDDPDPEKILQVYNDRK